MLLFKFCYSTVVMLKHYILRVSSILKPNLFEDLNKIAGFYAPLFRLAPWFIQEKSKVNIVTYTHLLLIHTCAYPHIRIYTYKLLILMHIFALRLYARNHARLPFNAVSAHKIDTTSIISCIIAPRTAGISPKAAAIMLITAKPIPNITA